MKKWLTMALATMGLGFAAWGETDREQWQCDPGGMRARMAQKLRRSGGTSQFPVPKSCDVRFVASEGGNLGERKWSGETIDFSLYIDRYYGTPNDIKKQIESGALPKTATLTMIVYDVDDHATGVPVPEHDQVSFNTLCLQNLTGSDGEWTKQTFDIPIEALNLPKNPGDVAENKIHIDVGVGSDPHTWVTEIFWASLDIPAAPPVVLAHGIRSNESTLENVKKAIEDFGVPVHTFSFNNNGNDGIYDGGKELSYQITVAKSVYNVDNVNIVAHSMGGLKARECLKSRNDVLNVFQIATPNGGSPLADLGMKIRLGALVAENLSPGLAKMISEHFGGFYMLGSKLAKFDLMKDQALADLSTGYMTVYNERSPLGKEVKYTIIAGDVNDYKRWTEPSYVSLITQGLGYWTFNYVADNSKGPNDEIVPVESAFALDMPTKMKLTGSAKTCSHSGLVDDGVMQTVGKFRNELTKQKSAKGDESKRETRRIVSGRREFESVEETPPNTKLFDTGVAGFGVAENISFGFIRGKNLTLTLSLVNIESVTATLTSPSGKVYSSQDESEARLKVLDSMILVSLVDDEIGEWNLSFVPVLPGAAQDEKCFYVLSGTENDVQNELVASLVLDSVKCGSSFNVQIQDKLDGNVLQGEATVIVQGLDGAVSSVKAGHVGGGIYRATIPATTKGTYLMAVKFRADAPVSLSSSCLISGVAYESGSAFNKTVNYNLQDEDGNGLCDRLNVSFDVTVDKAASYRVLATLSDTAGNEVCKAWSDTVSCTAGETTFSVAFDGWEINGHGACGGYKVSSAELIEMGDAYEATIDTMTDCLTISGHGYEEFEHELIELVGTWTESTTDDNGDGILDQLKIVAPVHVDDLMAGTYDWSASIRDGNGETIAYATGQVTFKVGENETPITMTFPGKEIAEKNVDGPYTVGNLILWGNGKNLTLGGEYLTKAYDVSSFGGVGHVDLAFVQPQEGTAAFGLCDKDGKPVDGFSQGEDVYVFANYANKIAGQAVPSPFKAGIVCPNGESNLVDCAALAKDETGSFRFVAPDAILGLKPGKYELTFVLDANGVYQESDRENNVGKQSFTVRHRQLVPENKIKPFSTDPKDDYAIVAATKYGGYLLDSAGRMSGVIDIKVGKPSKAGTCSVSGSMTVLGAKKKSLKLPKGTKGISSGKKVGLVAGAETVTLDISGNALSGSYGKYTISGVRIDSKETFGGLSQETYALALFTGKASGEAADLAKGNSALTVAVKNKGKAKVSGVMGDGTKVSTTAQMLAGESDYCLPVLSQLYGKKTGGFGLLIWIDQKGKVQVDGLSDWDASSSSSPFKAAFSNEVPVASIADAKSPRAFELPGKLLSQVAGQKVYTELLPSSVKLTVAGNKWNAGKSEKVTVDGGKVQGGTNPSALKLTYAPKTGLFKGGFTVYSDSNGKLKKTKATVTGVMVEGRGYGSAVIKKTSSMPVKVGK